MYYQNILETGYANIGKLDKCLDWVNPLILRDHVSSKLEIFGDKRSKKTQYVEDIQMCFMEYSSKRKMVNDVNFENGIKEINLLTIEKKNKRCYLRIWKCHNSF